MKKPIRITNPLLLLGLALMALLAGCQGMMLAFSPEAAARQAVLESPMPEFTVDPASIQVLQTAALGEKRIVLISFQGNRLNTGREFCLFSYETVPGRGGWRTGSGGGGCGGGQQNPASEPISIGSGMSGGGGPADVGYSEVSGQVYDSQVSSVRVTWADGAVQQAGVVNHSYLIVRAGQFEYSKVEALDADEQVVFGNEPQVAPGKR